MSEQQFSEEQIKEMKDIFTIFDIDGDGNVTISGIS